MFAVSILFHNLMLFVRESMVVGTSTWQRIIIPIDVEKRACVFCGALHSSNKKVISIDTVEDIMDDQNKALSTEVFSTTMRNICASAVAAFYGDKGEHGSHASRHSNKPIFSSCYCCHHWVERRKNKKDFMFPLQAMRWYVNTLHCDRKKNLDHRVVYRLSRMLQPHAGHGMENYYNLIYSENERDLFRSISKGSVNDVGDLVARFYYWQNGLTMFMASAKIVENIRRIA